VTDFIMPAQNISIAINPRSTLSRISKIVSDILTSDAQTMLGSVRACSLEV